MFTSLVVSVFLAASTLVQASPMVPRGTSDSVTLGFLAKLNDLGLTTSGGFWEGTINSPGGDYLVSLLNSQKVTVLISENDAYDPNNPSIGSDPLSVLSYCVVFGTPEDGFKITDSSLTRKGANQSKSSASSGVPWPNKKRSNGLLDNNQVQIIEQFFTTSRKRWSDNPLIIIDRPVDSATVVSRSSYKNIVILVIDKVLTLPTTVSDLLYKPLISSTPNGFVKFGGGLKNAGLLDNLDNGFKSTVLVPTDEAFEEAGLSGDEISPFLKNHYFLSTIVYSTVFPYIPKATAESGKELEFIYEDGVHYVQCCSSKAIILRSDVTSKWGVVHVIDKVLKCD